MSIKKEKARRCPKCGSEMEPSVCLEGVWYCTACLNEVHEEKVQGGAK